MSWRTKVMRWWRERLRDFFLWPLNLVRDFPVRAGRVADAVGVRTGPLLIPPDEVASRLHRFLIALFDLMGGPELVQFVVRLGMTTSPLSEREKDVMMSVLGPQAVRYHDVRIAEGGVLSLVFRVNGGRAFVTWHTVYLPSAGAKTRQNLSLLVHELVHVFQYERIGSRYIGEALMAQWRQGRGAYRYGGSAGLARTKEAGLRYESFNREAQAQIVQDYYHLREKGEDVSAYDPFIQEMRAGAF